MDLRAALRTRSPTLYKSLVVLRHRQHRVRDLPRQLAATRTLRQQEWVEVDVDHDVGMGGVLLNAACALAAGRRHSCRVRLRFTSRTYLPSWQPVDWLDSYFDRLEDGPNHQPPVLRARHISTRFQPAAHQGGHLVWSALSIRPEICRLAAPHMEGAYAAVHYRGSDKYLESGRVDPLRLLDVVAEAMDRRGLERLFATSDEPWFVELVEQRFGADVVDSVPLTAVAVRGVPPHFSDVAGEIKATEALVTMLALSGAQVCVHTPSFLSAWAQTLAPSSADFVLVAPGTIGVAMPGLACAPRVNGPDDDLRAPRAPA